MQVEKTKENACNCLCMMCPSYEKVCKLKNQTQNQDISTQSLQNETHYEKLFCAFEKSNCIHVDCLKTGGI